MPRSLGDYLELRLDEARAQWARVAAREAAARQPPFEPVEVLLCYALFQVVDPHGYGGGNIHRAPAEVHMLAAVFRRSPGSITQKMLNLDGSRPNAAAREWEVFVTLGGAPDHFARLYTTVIRAAREAGIDATHLPDFLSAADGLELLGQDEVVSSHLHVLVDARLPRASQDLHADERVTTRLLEHAIRLGQHRFARRVLANFGHACAFCGLSSQALPRHRLLVASHIKPWAHSNDRERLDFRNGVAACPTHDAAFDTGLISVNGGLRIHRAPRLEAALHSPGLRRNFDAPVLQSTLVLPPAATPPLASYFDYHRAHVFHAAS